MSIRSKTILVLVLAAGWPAVTLVQAQPAPERRERPRTGFRRRRPGPPRWGPEGRERMYARMAERYLDRFTSTYELTDEQREEVRLRLEELVALYPRHHLVDDARTLIGDCYFDQGDYSRALEHYIRVIKENPEGDRFPTAALQAAFAYDNLGETEKARAVLEEVVRRFPGSEEALRAEERLRLLAPTPPEKNG